MNRASILMVLVLLCISIVLAAPPQIYHLKLLAVQESADGKLEGSDADLYLELKPGTGRVFLDTFPVTKMDTQISTRFAKEIACSHFKLNCNKYDFIYTIKAKTNIIGGPSAGAAIAAVTTIAVLDLPYDEDVAITGTVNSGGIIGPVGGVQQKLEAASAAGLQKVLIAPGVGSRKIDSLQNRSNQSINVINNVTLFNYSTQELGLEVQEVGDLDDVLLAITGKDLNHKEVVVIENERYREIMKNLNDVLCRRGKKIASEIAAEGVRLNQSTLDEVRAKQDSAKNATMAEDHYSSASFCFGTNILLKTAYYEKQQLTGSQLNSLFRTLEKKAMALEKKADQKEIESISDLQTYMVVKERLNDVSMQLARFTKEQDQRTPEEFYAILAYAEERYFSAVSWMQFFEMDGKTVIVDQTRLRESCQSKIAEAEERHQYATLFIGPVPLLGLQEKIAEAQAAAAQNESALCLITAAQAKADASAVLTSLGLDGDFMGIYLESKRKAVERVIAENSQEGMFPILGYSYYQYAQSLESSQPFTALVYYEYALEMSDLSIYFPEEKEYRERVKQWLPTAREAAFFTAGIILGALVLWGGLLGLAKRKQKQAPRRRSLKRKRG